VAPGCNAGASLAFRGAMAVVLLTIAAVTLLGLTAAALALAARPAFQSAA
jgi:hypothetical protein